MSEHAAVPSPEDEPSDDGSAREFVSAREQVRRRVADQIDRAVLARREIARWQAQETAALAAAGALADEMRDTSLLDAEREMPLRSIAAAFGASTRQSDRSVQRQIGDAVRLVRDLPDTFAAFAAGDLSRGHVAAVMDATANLSDDAALASVDAFAAQLGRRESANRLRAALRTAADQVDPRSLVERHRTARAERDVVIVDLPNSMAQMIATMPAVLAKGIDDRLTQQAREVKNHEAAVRAGAGPAGGARVPGDPSAPDETEGCDASAQGLDAEASMEVRTIAQIRADILADMLLTAAPGADPTAAGDGPGALGAIRGIVQVSVPLGVLFPGPGDGPARTGGPAHTGDITREPGDSVRKPGDSGRETGDSGRETGDSARGTGDSARGTGDSARGTGDSARGTDDAARGTSDAARQPSDSAGDPSPVRVTSRAVAEIPGFGPIDDESARELAANAPGWDLIYRAARAGFDSGGGRGGGGEVISVARYRRSAEMARFLRARDEHCRFPGCRAPVHRCDVDHNIDAALGGATATDNLAHFCRRHHSLKQAAPAWTVRQLPGGIIEWTSPFGATYTDVPPGMVRFEPAPF